MKAFARLMLLIASLHGLFGCTDKAKKRSPQNTQDKSNAQKLQSTQIKPHVEASSLSDLGEVTIFTDSPIVSRGGLVGTEVLLVIRAHKSKLQHCYEQFLKKASSKSEGRMTVTFVIDPRGRTDSIQVGSDTIPEASMRDCITTAVKGWKFPSPRAGSSVQAQMKLGFNVRSNRKNYNFSGYGSLPKDGAITSKQIKHIPSPGHQGKGSPKGSLAGGIVIVDNDHSHPKVKTAESVNLPKGVRLQSFKMGRVKTAYGSIQFEFMKDFGDLQAIFQADWKKAPSRQFSMVLLDKDKKEIDFQGTACFEKNGEIPSNVSVRGVDFYQAGKGNIDQVKFFAIYDHPC